MKRAPRQNPGRRQPALAGRLQGRVALITGGGRGIGRAVAESLARRGARIVLAARTRAEIERVARKLEAAGSATLAVPCDVRDAAQVQDLVRAAERRFHRIDILVNNAGAFQIRPFADTDEELWDTILDTNLKATYLVTRAALPLLLRRRGHIVNVSSVAGRIAFAGSSAYCASKWGVLGLSAVLREELRTSGVRVTAVLPGAVDTPIWSTVPGDWDRTGMLRPAQVAEAIAELCCQPASACADELMITPTLTAR